MKMVEEFVNIGQIANRSGVSIHTIRYYENPGLLNKPSRSEGGFRKYPENIVDLLKFINKAKRLGFTLNEIQKIIKMSQQGLEPCCQFVNKALKVKLSELEFKMQELKAMKKSLKGLIEDWIPLHDAKHKKYVVCPQIETERRQKKGRKKNVKKKC